jgi:hypothetical protein
MQPGNTPKDGSRLIKNLTALDKNQHRNGLSTRMALPKQEKLLVA